MRLTCLSLGVMMVAACNFDASGQPGSVSIGEGGTEGETEAGETGRDSSAEGAETGSASGDTGGPSTSGALEDTGVVEEDTGVVEEDTGGAEEDTGGAEEDTGVDDGNDTAAIDLAELEFSGALPIELGLVVIGQHEDAQLTLVNVGPGDATSLAADPLASPFSFAGGAYPGEGGSCGPTLASGDSCVLVLRFAPEAPVLSSETLVMSYDPGDGSTATSTRELHGGGETANLLVNPAAASGLTGWVQVAGNWSSNCVGWGVDPHTGSACFTSAPDAVGVETSILRQQVTVSQWATEIDEGQVSVEVRGWGRSYTPTYGDPWRILGAARSDSAHIAWMMDSGWAETFSWTEVDGGGVLPTGTTTLRVSLACEKPSWHTYCDAFFDDLELILRPAL